MPPSDGKEQCLVDVTPELLERWLDEGDTVLVDVRDGSLGFEKVPTADAIPVEEATRAGT